MHCQQRFKDNLRIVLLAVQIAGHHENTNVALQDTIKNDWKVLNFSPESV